MNPGLRARLDALPASPGCYLFRDAEGRLLYVGKAASLRQRVRSYFQPSARHSPRILRMVQETADLEILLTDTELEALLLESNLVRRHRPRYNVRLRDDKSFPYLRLSVRDPFPRVTLVRRVRRDGAAYFGPYLPARVARRTLRMVPRFFKVANCHVPFDGKQRPCLYYHLDQCEAPCAGKADAETYAARVEEVRLFLDGRHDELRGRLHRAMGEAAGRQEYERAASYRDLLASIERLADRQNITTTGLEDGDYWASCRREGRAMVELFRMREGRVHSRREFRIDRDTAGDRFYDEVLSQYYLDETPPARVFLEAPAAEPELLEGLLRERRSGAVTLRVPRRGVRRRFLALVGRNAGMAFEERFHAPHRHGTEVVEELREVLDLDAPPLRIECLDVSHTGGAQPYTSVVVFEGGRPRKSDYRLYKIREATGGDDYASLTEAARRRYGRMARGEGRRPDLVLVDGGPGQLAAVREAVDGVGLEAVPVASIAKREEEIFVEGRGEPVLLDRDSPVLHLIQRLRDEAHRFAVRHHRKARTRAAVSTRLTGIPGIGPVSARRLLRKFGSVQGVRSASEDALAAVVGPARARVVRASLDEAGDV